MANYDIFDEQYYLSQYPWLKPATDAGIIKSGKEHFEKFGQAAGLTKISRYFDEDTYLAGNPDIAPFVRTPNNPNAPFASGLDHFIQYGYEQGRSQVSPEYDEAFYVANNRDLLPFIQNGTFKNGYQHFVKFGVKDDFFGRRDGRFGTSFFERDYLQRNPDILPFVNSGALKTGREHYVKFGQFEPNRTVTFVGTSGNDTVTGFGVGNVNLIGIEVGISGLTGLREFDSIGTNEFDTLIGGSGRDNFQLVAGLNNQRFYEGPGFATIQNFTKRQDSIQLPFDLDQYILSPINNNRDLAIQTKLFDTIAVIEGGGNLSLSLLSKIFYSGPFILG